MPFVLYKTFCFCGVVKGESRANERLDSQVSANVLGRFPGGRPSARLQAKSPGGSKKGQT